VCVADLVIAPHWRPSLHRARSRSRESQTRPASPRAVAFIVVDTTLAGHIAPRPAGPGRISARIYIRDPHVRDAVGQTFRSAAEWLKAPRCQTLLTEFSDQRGRALTERLAELQMSLAEYLDAIIVEDGLNAVTRPAAMFVEPEVSWCFSRRRTSFQPASARW